MLLKLRHDWYEEQGGKPSLRAFHDALLAHGSAPFWALRTSDAGIATTTSVSGIEGLMPLYEYQCDTCAHRFEVIQKYSDAPIEVCPKCGGAVKKLLSSPAIQFKGTGWYITDYAQVGQQGQQRHASRRDASPTASSSAVEVGNEDRDEVRDEAGHRKSDS